MCSWTAYSAPIEIMCACSLHPGGQKYDIHLTLQENATWLNYQASSLKPRYATSHLQHMSHLRGLCRNYQTSLHSATIIFFCAGLFWLSKEGLGLGSAIEGNKPVIAFLLETVYPRLSSPPYRWEKEWTLHCSSPLYRWRKNSGEFPTLQNFYEGDVCKSV